MSHPVPPPRAEHAPHSDHPAAGSAEAANEGGRTHAGHSLRAALIGAVAVTAVLLAFIWPSITTTTKHLPVLVVGTSAQEQKVTAEAEHADAGFDVRHVSSRAEAEEALKHREAYAAFVFAQDSQDLEVLTASAASPVAAQLAARSVQGLAQKTQMGFAAQLQKGAQEAAKLGAQAAGAQGAAKTLAGVLEQMSGQLPPGSPQLAAMQAKAQEAGAKAEAAGKKAAAAKSSLQAASAPKITVTDVAPLDEADPRGANLALAGMPLTMGGMIGGIIVSFLLRGTRSRLLGVAAYGALAGLAIVLVMHTWFHVLQGEFLLEWAASALSLGATAALISGLQALLGQPGIGLGAVITMFVGNPISSMQSPKEFLPAPWGEIGQHFVPGATGTLLRDLSYFPEAPMAQSWWVLAAWLAAGTAFSLLAAARGRRPGRR